MSRNIQQLVDYMSFTTWLLVSVAVAVIPYSRWKYPDLHRPFKVSKDAIKACCGLAAVIRAVSTEFKLCCVFLFNRVWVRVAVMTPVS